MKIQNMAKSKLQLAEASFNASFGVITKIQKAAEAAGSVAADELLKAEIERDKYQIKMNDMSKKSSFYFKRARKIADFIASLDD